MARKKKGRRIVKTVGWYIDRHYRLKEQRDKLIDELNAKKEEIEVLAEEALEKFTRNDIVGAKGRFATGYIQDRDVYSVSDRSKLDAFVKRTGLLEVYQNRVTSEAVDDILEMKPRLTPASLGLDVFTIVNFRTRRR